MTTFDEVIDIAMITINDYELELGFVVVSEENFDLIQQSLAYGDYKARCYNVPEFIAPVTDKRYDFIIGQQYVDYEEYCADMEQSLMNKLYAYLVRAIPNFENCSKKGSVDYEQKMFQEELTDIEKSIFADLTVLAWLERENNDVRQFRGMIQNKSEANRYSEANLLKERNNKEKDLRERIDTKKIRYDMNNNFNVGSWSF